MRLRNAQRPNDEQGQSANRLALTMRALRGYCYDWNVLTGERWFDGALQDITGFSVAEVHAMGLGWADRIHPQDRAAVAQAREAAIAAEAESFSAEYRFAHRDGHYIWVWDHAVARRDDEGMLLQLVGNVLDITDRKQAQLALQASERRYRAALTATAEIHWTQDATGLMRAPQAGWQSFTGQSPVEYVGEGWVLALHPEDAERALHCWHHAVEQGRAVFVEYRARRHDGAYRLLAVHAIPVRDEQQRIVEWVGVSRDITDQRATEQALREATQRLQLALDTAAIGMWDWDLKRDRLSLSRECHVICDIAEGAFDGDPVTLAPLLQPTDRLRVRQIVQDALDTGQACGGEFRLRRPDGQRRWVALQATVQTDAAGVAQRAIGTLIDITDRKQLEQRQQLQLEAERAARSSIETAAHLKDDFLSTIAHELRTPLNAMLGWTDLLQKPRATAETLAKGLRIIERNGRLQAQLINDLLDANRLMSGKFDFDLQALHPDDVIRAAADSLAPTFAAKSVQLTLQLGCEHSLIEADLRRLQQVIVNLLSNAAKFSESGATVRVRSHCDGQSMHIDVIDQGEGIAAEFLPYVFDRFRQAPNGSARRHGGLGLGLAIAKQIVGAFGGTLSASSDGEGRGACFRVSLPLVTSKSVAAAQFSATPAAESPLQDNCLQGLRILLVDDEPEALDYVTRLLGEQGAQVFGAADAVSALSLYENAQPLQLLISDIGMREMDGYALLQKIRESQAQDAPQMPALALTAFGRHEDRDAALAHGFEAHLAKPFEAAELIRLVKRLGNAAVGSV